MKDFTAVHLYRPGCMSSVYVRLWSKTVLQELDNLCASLLPGTKVFVYDPTNYSLETPNPVWYHTT